VVRGSASLTMTIVIGETCSFLIFPLAGGFEGVNQPVYIFAILFIRKGIGVGVEVVLDECAPAGNFVAFVSYFVIGYFFLNWLTAIFTRS
jgi:hypothetical protein